jgi:hypothetical protein
MTARLEIARKRRSWLMLGKLDNAHGHAAIHYDVFTGDEVVFDQRDNHVRNLFGTAFAMQGDAIAVVIDLFGCKVRLKGRANDARRNAVDTDVLVGQLASEATRELR